MNKNRRHGDGVKPIAYYNITGGIARHNIQVICIVVLGVLFLFGALAIMATMINA